MSKLILYSVILLFSLISTVSAKDAYVQRLGEADQKIRFDILLQHGVGLSVDEIMTFFEGGFDQGALRRGLPKYPTMKSDVVLAAIQELGFKQDPAAIPVLTELMQGKMPQGVRSVLVMDTETLPIETGQLARERQATMIRFNAMVALGLIGKQESADPIRQSIQQEQSDSFALEGALALGLLEQKDSLDILINHFQDPASEYMDEAFQAVFFLTGRNYDVSEHASWEKKAQSIEKLNNWWKENKNSYDPWRADILRRRQAGMVLTTPPIGTVRGALRATKDFEDYDNRYSGRQYLKGRGPVAAAEFQMIANDPLEDLDIRVAAMEWYAASAPDRAKKDFKGMAEDAKDKVVRDKAESLLQDIKELKEYDN